MNIKYTYNGNKKNNTLFIQIGLQTGKMSMQKTF